MFIKKIFILIFITLTLYAEPNFTKEEKTYIKNNPIIIVGGEMDWAPFNFVDKEGQYQGIVKDYLDIISQKSALKFNIITGYTRSELIENFKNKKIDLLPSEYYSKEKEKYASYTMDYYTVRDYLFVKNITENIKSFEDLKGKVLAIPQGYTIIDKIKKEHPQIEILETKDLKDSIASILSSQADAILEVHAVMDYALHSQAINAIKVVSQDTIGLNPLHMIVEKENTILLSILNKSISDIDKDIQQEIAKKWISRDIEDFITPEDAVKIAAIFGFVLSIFVYRQYILSKVNGKLEEDKKIIEKYVKIIDENVITSSTNTKGIIISASEAFSKISGYSKSELIGKSHNIIRHPDMKKEVFEDMWHTLKLGKTWKGEIKNKKKNGDYYWVNATISPFFSDKNEIAGYTAIRANITDKKIIEQISITDGLTNIYNRRHFNELFPKIINSAKRENHLINFLIMDIDHFKQYNDTYGHQAGDDVLKKVALCMKDTLHRADDYCFRLGGEEFGVMFVAKDKKSAFLFSNTIRQNIENLNIEHKSNSASPFITVSMGLISKNAREINSEDEIYKDGDDLLYKAKENGRNKVVANF